MSTIMTISSLSTGHPASIPPVRPLPRTKIMRVSTHRHPIHKQEPRSLEDTHSHNILLFGFGRFIVKLLPFAMFSGWIRGIWLCGLLMHWYLSISKQIQNIYIFSAGCKLILSEVCRMASLWDRVGCCTGASCLVLLPTWNFSNNWN